MIAKQTSRLTRLVDDMLRAGPRRRGWLSNRADTDSPGPARCRMRSRIGAPAEDKNITLNTDLHPTTVTGDETLRRRRWNLIGNGVTYTPSRLDRCLPTATDGHPVAARVGYRAGIPAEDRARVRAFRLLDPAELPEGPGLASRSPAIAEDTRDASRRVEQPCSRSVFVASLPVQPHIASR